MLKNKKILLIAIIATTIVIVAIIISAIVIKKNKKEPVKEREDINEEQLESEFDTIFNHEENEYVKTMFYVTDEKAGKYNIDAHIPYINIESEAVKNINNEINQIFVSKLLEIGNNSTEYTIFKLDYATQVNDDILSIVIKCVLKEGASPQRTIIKTYNYNLVENKKVIITDLLSEESIATVSDKIAKKIEMEIKREQTIVEQGYDIYRRDKDSELYKVENATEFYIGEDKVIYIIYSYGNSNYTTETDIIVTKIR